MRRIDRHLLVLLAVWCGVLAAGPAQARSCQTLAAKAKLDFKIDNGKVIYANDRSKVDLSRHHRRIGQDLEVRGLTETQPRVRYRISYRSVRYGHEYCISPTAIEATIGFDTINVWVASEYRKGSCQYNAVLRHEQEHVAAHRLALRNHKRRIEGKLRRVLDGFEPLLISEGDDPVTAIGAVLDKQMDEVLTALGNEAEDRNAEIDLPRNYRQVGKACRSW